MPLPPDFADGNILTAGELNTSKSARDGNLLPIDETTGNENNELEDVGSDVNRWKGAHFKSTDDVNIGGQTLTQILEGNVIDAIASEEVLSNNFSSTGTYLNASFTKNSQDKILRIKVAVFALASTLSVNIGGGAITRSYSGSSTYKEPFDDWFDISGLSDGSTNVTITGSSTSGTAKAFRNAF